MGAEHPGKAAASRKAWLYVLLLYGGAYLCGRAAGWLPTLPTPLPERTACPPATELFLPLYLAENVLRNHPPTPPQAPTTTKP